MRTWLRSTASRESSPVVASPRLRHMTGKPEPRALLSVEELAVAILKEVEFAEHSDDEAARHALREIAALCRRALKSAGTAGEAIT